MSLQDIKHTGKKGIGYSFGNIFVKIAGFILLPFYTTYLSVEDYGILAIIESTIAILLPIISLNINQAVLRFLENKKNKNIVLTNALFFLLLNSIILTVILILFSDKIANLLFGNLNYGILIKIMAINLILGNLLNLLKKFYNSQQKALTYSALNILFYTLFIAFTIFFLVVKNLGLKGVLLAQMFSFIIVLVVFFPPYFSNMKPFKLNIPLGKKMLNYSSPVAFSDISSMIFTFGDRYVLNFIDTRNAVGLYSMAIKFVNISEIAVLQSFRLAYMPYAFKNYQRPDFKTFHSKLTTYIVLLLFFISLGISLFAHEVLIIFSPKNPLYWTAASFIPLIVFLKPLSGLRFMWGIGLHIQKKTRPIPFMVILGAVVNIVLNILLIPSMHIYGAILSSVISSIMMDILYFKFSTKIFRVSYEIKRILFLFVYSVPFLLSFYLFYNFNFWLSIFIKFFIWLLYPSILWFIGFIREDERLIIINFFKTKLKKR